MTLARAPRIAYLAVCLIAALALLGFYAVLGRSVALPDAAAPGDKLLCVSYSPFAWDQSPFDAPFVLRLAQMDADLALLASRFECVRTYSMTGLEAIPDLARKHGLKLLLGAWINADPVASEAEIDLLIAAAQTHPDVVQAVIVGNETLLRREVTAARLAGLIARVRQAVVQPVTYADVWEFWLSHPEIAPAVDFLTIHLLPYWEDDPAGIEDALLHVGMLRDQFGRQFAPKGILIGETGWPSAGRQRETAVPSPVNQAHFMRGFVRMAQAHGWAYNLIEAFDQPWKRVSEGAVGGYWGLFDAERRDKGVLRGPVSNLAQWPRWAGAALALFGATLLLAGRPKDRLASHLLPWLAALGSACCVLYAEQAWSTSRFAGEWLWAGVLLGLNLLVLAHASLALARPQGWRAGLAGWLERRAGWLVLLSGFAGAVLMLGLVFDPRYRSFPSAALLLPALVFVCRPVPVARRESALLALLIGAGIAPQLYQEGLANTQALGWALVCALLCGALWRCRNHRAPAHPSSASMDLPETSHP